MLVMTATEQEALLREITLRIVREFHPDRIVLFGSHARGDANPDSDIDLLIVMSVAGSIREQATAIDLALADRTYPLDVVVVTPSQFARLQQQEDSLVFEALRVGKVLYDHAA